MAKKEYLPVVHADGRKSAYSGSTQQALKTVDQMQGDMITLLMKECAGLRKQLRDVETTLERRVRALEARFVRQPLPVVRLDGRRGK